MREPTTCTTLGSTWRCMQEDIDEFARRAYPTGCENENVRLRRRLAVLLVPPVICGLTYRIAHWLHVRGLHRLAGFLSWLNFVVHRADLSPASEIGRGLYMPHTSGVVFRGRAGTHLTLFFRSAAVSASLDMRRDRVDDDCPQFGHHVTLGALSFVKGPVRIGNGVFVGAASVVVRDLPAN